MRAWKITGKYPVYNDEGKISHTDVSIASTDGVYATLTERLTGDCRQKGDKELVSLVLDVFFKSEFADKAMAESVQKVDEFERMIASFRKEMAELKEVTLEEFRADVQDKSAKLENSLKITVMTINEMLLKMEKEEDDFDSSEESDE